MPTQEVVLLQQTGHRRVEILKPQQEIAIHPERFECPDIECGVVFWYRRISCGHFIQPAFCPNCGGRMEAPEENQMEALPDGRKLQNQQNPRLLPLTGHQLFSSQPA